MESEEHNFKDQDLKDLVLALEKDKLVLFVGNGLSRIFGLPSWEKLANGCLYHLADKRTQDFSFGTYNLLKEVSPRQKLSIAFNTNEAVAWEGLRKSLEFKGKPDDLKTFYELWTLSPFILTTNYDTLLEDHPAEPFTWSGNLKAPKSLGKSVDVLKPKDLIEDVKPYFKNALNPQLIKLHGCSGDDTYEKNNHIITTESYAEFYNKSKIKDFLRGIFTDYTVLFLGYSLSEMEILEQIVRAGCSNISSSEVKNPHFMFFSVYQFEKGQPLDGFRKYWEFFNINLIPYEIDEKYFAALFDGIVTLRKAIQTKMFPPGKIDFQESERLGALVREVSKDE
ncbi:MAG: SIR2 family protein [Proteobacteria bacterium]|nr:SIR2 family protein [Pseudomonadota bacterium]